MGCSRVSGARGRRDERKSDDPIRASLLKNATVDPDKRQISITYFSRFKYVLRKEWCKTEENAKVKGNLFLLQGKIELQTFLLVLQRVPEVK